MDHKKKILHQLYIELVKLQKEIIASNLRVIVILEGRDAAGKDGTIKRIIKQLSPRETKVIALGKPSDRESREWYFQRYTGCLPVSGEFVIFNRSWYNRAGVEKVMGFCSDKEYRLFFKQVDLYEKMLVDSGFIVLKYYLDISKEEQENRLDDRKEDPLKQWKISPIDAVAQEHWKDYSETRNEMLLRTNFDYAPWFVAEANHKKKMHIALISHLLSQFDYKNKNKDLLSSDYGLVYPVIAKSIRDKLN